MELECIVGLLKNVYTLWELSLTILRHKKRVKKLLKKNPYQLGDFSDRFKTKRMCEKAVEDEP